MIVARAVPIPRTANLVIAGTVLFLNVVLLCAIPIWLLPRNAAWGWLIIPIVLTTPLHWSIIHEAIHDNGLPRPKQNSAFGRVLSIIFGSPFYVLRFGHLSHHALNSRCCDRPDVYDPRTISRLRAAGGFYTRLLFGLYATEIAANLLVWLPRHRLERLTRKLFHEGRTDAGNMHEKAVRHFLAPARLRAIRLDAFLILLLYGAAFTFYGAYWSMLALAIAGRGVIVSVLDSTPHYGGAIGDFNQGFNLYLPPPLARGILYFNYHGIHHRHPNLPWPGLPVTFESEKAVYNGHYLIAPFKQLAGPIPLDRIRIASSTVAGIGQDAA